MRRRVFLTTYNLPFLTPLLDSLPSGIRGRPRLRADLLLRHAAALPGVHDDRVRAALLRRDAFPPQIRQLRRGFARGN